MIVDKQFLLKLKELGLNSYEAKLWVSLLSRGSSIAGELSDISTVPRSRTYDVLESLKSKGFIRVKNGKPITYIAVPPEEVIDQLKNKAMEKAANELKMIGSLDKENILDELNSLHSQGTEQIGPNELMGALKGRDNLYNHIDSMIKKSKKSVDIHTTDLGVLRKLKHFSATLVLAKKNGVKIKFLTNTKNLSKADISEINKFAELKHTDVQSRYILIDNSEAILMLGDEETHPSYDIGVWLTSPEFPYTMKQLFEKEFVECVDKLNPAS